MLFNPTLHTAWGIAMATVIDGLIEGAKAAETDFGVRCAFIADVYRQDPPPVARQMVEEVLAHRRPELIGLGMDAAEAPDPPEKFVEEYRVAKAAGLWLTRRTARPRT
jgi:adenosine deaminase